MEDKNINKQIVLFTDVKDFTLKTSLLTSSEITKLLDIHEDIVQKYVNLNGGKTVKSLGDSFMVIFDDIESSIKTAVEIEKFFYQYNKNLVIDLDKIEVKIAISYGELNKKKSLNQDDYFGESVNLSSRILSKTPENEIFVSGTTYENLKNKNKYPIYSVGKTKLKGIIEVTEVFHLLYNKEDILDLSTGEYNKLSINGLDIKNYGVERNKEIDGIITKTSSIGAIVSLQPIPLMDITNMLPFQVYLVRKIAILYGIQLTVDEIKEIIKSLITSIGGAYLLGQGMVGITKLGLPFIGGYIIMPVNYGLIYGFGKIVNVYLYHKANNIEISNKRLKLLFSDFSKKGKNIGKIEKQELKETTIEKTNKVAKEVNDIKAELEHAAVEGAKKAKEGAAIAKEGAITAAANAKKLKDEAVKMKENIEDKIKKED